VFLHIDDISGASLARAYDRLLRQKQPAETDDEGVLKELQSM
jgi:hypothetical protein